MTIHMLLEVKARELEGRALIAFRAALSGHQVFIGRASQIIEGIRLGVLPAGVCFEKSISAAKKDRLESRFKYNNILVCQDEESGLLSESYEEFLNIRSSAETLALTTAFFCWGGHDAAAWKMRYPQFAEKIYITGSPRVDFWRRDFDAYFFDEVLSLKRKYGSYVLVVSNFAAANGIISPEELLARAWDSGYVKNNQEAHAYMSSLSDDARMFQEFVVLLRDLSARSLGVQFVVRPHPAERFEPWLDSLDGCSNVHVVFEGGISSWVRGALAIVHNGCTTALESYVAGVPALAYVPFASPRNRDIPNRLSICRATADELASDICSLLAGLSLSSRSVANDELIEGRLSNVSGETSVARIVSVLDEIFSGVSRSPHWVQAKLLDLKFRVRGFVRKKILRRYVKTDRKFPSLQLGEVLEIRDRLALCDPAYQRCEVRHVYGDVFLIEAKK